MSPEGNGLTEIFEVHQEPVLREPILVVALEGWVDAGLGATTAIATLLGQSHTEPLVTFNGEHFLDQRARRPVARIVNGITTELNWPRTVVRHGTDESGRDMLFLVGPEPDFHWRAFTRRRGRAGPLLARPHGGGAGCLPGAGTPHAAGEAGRHGAGGVGQSR